MDFFNIQFEQLDIQLMKIFIYKTWPNFFIQGQPSINVLREPRNMQEHITWCLLILLLRNWNMRPSSYILLRHLHFVRWLKLCVCISCDSNLLTYVVLFVHWDAQLSGPSTIKFFVCFCFKTFPGQNTWVDPVPQCFVLRLFLDNTRLLLWISLK